MVVRSVSRYRVASPSSLPLPARARSSTALPRPWPDLSVETQTQIAQLLADLLRQMQSPPLTKGARHADGLEQS